MLLLPEAEMLNKNPFTCVGYLCRSLVKEVQEHFPQQTAASLLGCLPEWNDKTLLPKTPHTVPARYRKLKLDLSSESPSRW